MDVRGTSQIITKIETDAIAIPVFKGEKADDGLLRTLDKAVDNLLSSVIKTEEFSGKEGETAYFHLNDCGLRARRLLLIGCGERADYKWSQLSQMAGTAARFLRSKNAKTIAIVPRSDADVEKVAETVITGAVMGLFDPDKYRTKDKELRQIERFEVVIEEIWENHFSVSYDRWHEDFYNLEEAIDCFFLGLSNHSRLKVQSKDGSPFRWTVEYLDDTQWKERSSNSVWNYHFLSPVTSLYLQNDLLSESDLRQVVSKLGNRLQHAGER